jgi:hypothetical protein
MFTDIDKNLVNGENMGGIAQVIYYAKWDEVETWPAKPSSPTTLAANGVLTGDIAMKSGKSFHKLYITDDTGEFQIEPVGEKDGKSYVLHLRLFHPGLNTEILGFNNLVKNENMVFIVPDNNGAKFIMGDATRPATFEGAADGQGTGKETAARRGIGMEFTYKTANVYQYTGSVPLTEASGS